ncbi:MAG: tetratricopeptide repeat protein, partial [Pelolinea sp.]|nr:tetratricopeptide repeat protein [Pelolinea sp.]
AGYGKTSLLVDFAHQFDWPVCWFAIEQIVQDFTRFISHFIFSIKQKFPKFGSDAINLLENTPPDQINLDFLITIITNSIFDVITEHFILVLDDYHLLQSNQKIDRFLSDFVQRTDENCHIAITSRKLLTLPDLPLMVARSQVGGLSVEELAFQPDEILKLFNQFFNKQISAQQAKDLAINTEGWITGLLLTSQTLKKGMGDVGIVTRTSGIGLYEYLAQQVLDQQPQLIQDFLLNTSVLEEFNADLCASVLGNALSQSEDWNSLMLHIIQNNLFTIPISDESLWLRYHHLFRDFLQSTIKKQRPEDARKIKLELAQYFRKEGDWEKVFDIYVSLGEKEFIADLIASIGSEFISKGKIQKLDSWLSTVPENLYKNDPTLLSIDASIKVNQGKVQEGCGILDRVVDILRGTTDHLSLADNLIRRSAALRLLGDYDAATRDADEAIILTQKDKSLNHLNSEALRAKGIILYRIGELKKGLAFLKKAIQICDSNNREEDTARILFEVGAIHETLGQFSEAEQAYNRSLSHFQSVGDSIFQPIILNNLGVLQHSIGDYVKSFFNFEKSMHYSQATGNQRMEGFSLASIGDLYRDLSAIDEAEDAYQRALEIALIIEDQFLTFYLKIVQVRLSINKNQLKKAQIQLGGAQTIAKRSGSQYEINKLRLEKGVLEFWSGNFGKSVETLLLSADFFEKEGYIEDFIRNQMFLFLSYYKVGKITHSTSILDVFVNQMSDPKYHIPSMTAALEVKKFLKPLIKKKEIEEKISDIFDELNLFQKQAQKSRRIIRKQASVVAFAPAKIIIRTFGTIEIVVKNHALSISDWKTQTSRDLFLLFLAFPEGLTKEEVGLIFWPETSQNELKLSFKNAIYRMRHAIGSDVVIFQDTYYLFNRSVDYEYDVQNFISALKAATEETNIDEKLSAYKIALALYKGSYLPTINQSWVAADRERYLGMYTKAAEEIAGLYFDRKEFGASLEISQKALENNPFNEPFHRICMRNYAALGNKPAVAQQFEKFRSILQKEIGAQPSESTIVLYESLMNE